MRRPELESMIMAGVNYLERYPHEIYGWGADPDEGNSIRSEKINPAKVRKHKKENENLNEQTKRRNARKLHQT